jgi:hypothetical protein
VLFEFIFTLQRKFQDGISSESYRKFNLKISCNRGETIRQATRYCPLTRMNAYYPSYIADTVSKQNPRQPCIIYYRKVQHCETRSKYEMLLHCVSSITIWWPTITGLKRGGESCAHIENYVIIIKFFTVLLLLLISYSR